MQELRKSIHNMNKMFQYEIEILKKKQAEIFFLKGSIPNKNTAKSLND